MRATIRLRRGMALKALDADHEAVAELGGVLPDLEGLERLDCLLYLGRAEIWCERHAEALDYAEQAVALADTLGDAGGQAAAAALVSNALAMRGDEGDMDRALSLGDEALARWPAGAARLRARRPPPLAGGREVLDRGLRRLRLLRRPRPRSRRRGPERPRSSSAAAGSTRWRASAWASTRWRSRSSRESWRSPASSGRPVRTSRTTSPSCSGRSCDLAAARAASETALDASRDLAFGMPRRFALSDLLQTDLLAGDIGRAQADWPALWEDAERGGRLDALAVRSARRRTGRDRAARRADRERRRVGGEGRRGHRAHPPPEVRGAGACAPRSRARPARPQRGGLTASSGGGRARGRARQPRRPVADARVARRRRWPRPGDEAGAEVAIGDARGLLTAFAETLSPGPRGDPARLAPPRASSSTFGREPGSGGAADGGDPPRGPPVAVERSARPPGIAPTRPRPERVRVVIDEHVRPDLDGVRPLRRGTERHARHAVPVRLLLEAARVGRDDARLGRRRGEGEVPERLQ